MNQVNPAPGEMSIDRLYDLVRAQLQHEDTLITQRLSWLIASQAFLFSAYAITLNAPATGRSADFAHQQELLAILVPLVASAISVLILGTIIAGKLAMWRLLRHFFKYAPAKIPPEYPEIQGARLTRGLGISAPLLLPIIFTGVWIFLLLRRH